VEYLFNNFAKVHKGVEEKYTQECFKTSKAFITPAVQSSDGVIPSFDA
jgi:hypothetical protein